MKQMLLAAATAAVAMLLTAPVRAELLERTKDVDGTTIHYKVVLPSGYDPAKTYPTVLAFPGGPQTMDMVEGTLERNWVLLGERLGYIVVIPAAPDGQLFFEG